MTELTEQLIKFTLENSNFETNRDYISLSHISLPIEDLIKQYNEGFEDSEAIRLKCYKGYQMEKDLIRRLRQIFFEDIQTGVEIQVVDGLFKGHPDFLYCGEPWDCKSVFRDDWLPQTNKLPRRAFWQMQAYLLYLPAENGGFIYESRESGLIREYVVKPNVSIQNEIKDKVNLISQQVKSGRIKLRG